MQQLTALLLLLSLSILSRAQPLQKQKIKLFIDCSNSYCDMNFIEHKSILLIMYWTLKLLMYMCSLHNKAMEEGAVNTS